LNYAGYEITDNGIRLRFKSGPWEIEGFLTEKQCGDVEEAIRDQLYWKRLIDNAIQIRSQNKNKEERQ
jgi:uncharacterized protein YwgA